MTWPQTLVDNSYIKLYEYKFQRSKIFDFLKCFIDYHDVDMYYVYDWNFILKKYYTYYSDIYWKIYDIDETRVDFKNKYYVFPFYKFYSFIIYNKYFCIYNIYEDISYYHVTCKKNIINDLYKTVCNILNQKINKDEFAAYIIHCLNIVNANELLIKL